MEGQAEGDTGYVNSQSWQAWGESFEVLWSNTSFLFLASVGVAVAAVVGVGGWAATLTTHHHAHPTHNPRKARPQEEEEEDKREDAEQDRMAVDKVVEYSQHLPGQVKKAKHSALEKNIEQSMNAEQKQAEREIQSEQLAAIFSMMKEQEEKFGETTMDEIKDQMKLYCG
ncbi:Matrix-remodeling-associated protein 7 [Chionoecetes opilio]|uniref:Matrix-remodeling-associated protein 7 n=1 Tax=Chionoecetes opilio TaxID=41210 RepID=A0A8J5BZB9_CHIOP|nr:Matrix-remodeling-associated protein 7 [Chionoecetes opilio]